MKTYGEVDVYLHIFLTSVMEVSGQIHGPADLSLGKGPRYPVVKVTGWVADPVWTWHHVVSLHLQYSFRKNWKNMEQFGYLDKEW